MTMTHERAQAFRAVKRVLELQDEYRAAMSEPPSPSERICTAILGAEELVAAMRRDFVCTGGVAGDEALVLNERIRGCATEVSALALEVVLALSPPSASAMPRGGSGDGGGRSGGDQVSDPSKSGSLSLEDIEPGDLVHLADSRVLYEVVGVEANGAVLQPANRAEATFPSFSPVERLLRASLATGETPEDAYLDRLFARFDNDEVAVGQHFARYSSRALGVPLENVTPVCALMAHYAAIRRAKEAEAVQG
ncbi:MAG: hypothetical protein KGL39_03505 [Patescibacteria group bacterium]|nr:hypothetical protein [Patescibacteria group bacterium]